MPAADISTRDTSLTAKPKAYSYLRFSTPEQQRGDSFRRQTQMATEYARLHGLELDDSLTFRDLGVSAYRGANVREETRANRRTGALREFLRAVEDGLIAEGSYLLVESLDRISRENVIDAQATFMQIINAGVVLVTLNDQRTYAVESIRANPTDLIVSIVMMMRAHEESETKARRLKAAWTNKRANVATRPLTKIAPAWLRYDDDVGAFVGIPERVELVRRIFRLTLQGAGQHKITAVLNAEGIKPWGRATHWQRSYISKILTNPAAVGTLVPHTLEYEGRKRRRSPQEPVAGYFPKAVPESVFNEVQALLGTVRAPLRGRHVNSELRNVLGGMAVCPVCLGTATLVSKGKHNERYLVCAKAKAGAGCAYRSVRYDAVEDALLTRLPDRLAEIPAGQGAGDLDQRVVASEMALDHVQEQIETVLENLTHARSATLSATLRGLEVERDTIKVELQRLLDRREASAGPMVAQRVARLREALSGPLDRAHLNQALRAVFERAVVDYPTGLLELEWKQGGEPVAVPFAIPTGG